MWIINVYYSAVLQKNYNQKNMLDYPGKGGGTKLFSEVARKTGRKDKGSSSAGLN